MHQAPSENTVVTSIMCYEAKEKGLNLWIQRQQLKKKSTADTIVVRLEAKEIYSHVTQDKENIKLFWDSLHISKARQREKC